MGEPIGLDFEAVLAFASASGVSLPVFVQILPMIEIAIIDALRPQDDDN